MNGSCYAVLAPWHWTEVITDDGRGPTEHGDMVLFVRARTRDRAKVLAVRAWRRKAGARMLNRWERPDFLDDAGSNPFLGMRVETYDAVPDSNEEATI